MAEFLSMTKQEAMHLLNKLDVDLLGYDDIDLDEQMKVAQKYATEISNP